MLFSLAAFCFLVNADAGANTGGAERKLLEILHDERNWVDPSKEKGLLLVLEGAKLLRAKSCISVLLKHLTYSPPSLAGSISLVPVNMWYPVYDTLPAIGLPAVQPLLDELRITDPVVRFGDKNLGENERKHTLIISCLIKIYDQGGHGRELTRARIELEIKKYPAKEVEFLESALETKWLRND